MNCDRCDRTATNDLDGEKLCELHFLHEYQAARNAHYSISYNAHEAPHAKPCKCGRPVCYVMTNECAGCYDARVNHTPALKGVAAETALLYRVLRKCGLTHAGAEEVAAETCAGLRA